MPQIEKNETGLYATTIDGHVYEFEKWGAEEAMESLLDIGTLLGKPLSKLGAKAFTDGLQEAVGEELGEDTFASVLEGLMDQVAANRTMVMRLIKKLTSYKNFCDGKAINFDLHYRGELGRMMAVARAGLEVQYGNFFGAALGSVAMRRAGSPPQKDSHKT